MAARRAGAAAGADAADRCAHEPCRGDPEGQARVAAFQQGLQQLGWTDGRNVRIDVRWGEDDADRERDTRRNWSRLRRTSSWPRAPWAWRRCNSHPHLPIVFAGVGDPVGAASSIPWPGRAATSPALWFMNIVWAGNGWSCSRRSRRA